jgi:hypothetical protein
LSTSNLEHFRPRRYLIDDKLRIVLENYRHQNKLFYGTVTELKVQLFIPHPIHANLLTTFYIDNFPIQFDTFEKAYRECITGISPQLLNLPYEKNLITQPSSSPLNIQINNENNFNSDIAPHFELVGEKPVQKSDHNFLLLLKQLIELFQQHPVLMVVLITIFLVMFLVISGHSELVSEILGKAQYFIDVNPAKTMATP